MHVLFIPSWYPATPNDIGGSFFREQAHALARAGCRVGVIAPQLRSLRNWRSAFSTNYGIKVVNDDGVIVCCYHDMSWFSKIRFMWEPYWLWFGRRLYAHYVREYGKPDVIHAHSLLYGGCLARDLSRREGIPYLVTEHSSAYARGMVSSGQRRQARRAAQSAARRFAVSESFCGLLNNYLGMSDWRFMPNPVNSIFLRAPLLALPHDGQFTFLHISLFGGNKAVDMLIKAFAEAFKADGKTLLNIGGDGPELKDLQILAGTLGVATRVKFLGQLSRAEVMHQLQACHAFVLSSRHETFGVVLIEALAMGRPIVATRCGGPESIVRESNGLLVPVDDVAGLACAMRRMRERYNDYDAVRIRADCSEKFSERTVTGRLIREYSETLTNSRLIKGKSL